MAKNLKEYDEPGDRVEALGPRKFPLRCLATREQGNPSNSMNETRGKDDRFDESVLVVVSVFSEPPNQVSTKNTK